MAAGRLIVVCGLAAEAKIVVGSDRDDSVMVIAGGGDQTRLAAEIERAASGAAGILSFGVAGGLAPGLKPGDIRVADLVIAPDGTLFTPHSGWATSLRSGLARGRQKTWHAPDHDDAGAISNQALARFAGVDRPLADISGKAKLHCSTGADVVDMESHIAARTAARYSVPFAALRAVTDPANRSLPQAATVGMRADGTVDLAAILKSLGRNPGQLPGLIRTGLDARAAFASLLRSRQLLGSRFALLDL